MAKNLLDQLQVDDAIRNSYKNWHVKGVDYLCLYRSPQLTIKVYKCPAELQSENKNTKTILNPHTHLYNSHIVVLMGECEIVTFDYHKRSHQSGEPKEVNHNFTTHNLFYHTSKFGPRAKQAGFRFESTGHLIEKQVTKITEQQSLYMKADEIRSFRTIGETYLLIFQYNTIPFNVDTDLYVQTATPPILDELYQTFNESEIVNFINKIDYVATRKIEEE